MKERIEQIARGEIKYEKPRLRLDPPQIEETLAEGVRYRRELTVYSTNRVPVRGLVYSNHRQVAVEEGQFAGTRCRLWFTVNTADVRPGTEIAGEFCFVTNGREFTLPYRFSVTDAAGSQHPPESLDALYELAQRDEKQAAEVFAAPDFVKRPFFEQLRCLALYESLMRGGNARAALRAFLRGMGYPVQEPRADRPGEAEVQPQAERHWSSLTGLEGLANYRHLMDLLLEYVCGKYPQKRLLPEMEKEAARLVKVYPQETFPVLMRAFLAQEGGYRQASLKLLEDAYHAVLDRRRTEIENYCFYLYLRTRLGIPEEQRENIVKLLDKYYEELGRPFSLFFLVLTVNRGETFGPEWTLRQLDEEYGRGTRSPFLYAEALKWYNLRPELLTELDAFAWEALAFGAEYGAVKPVPKKALRHGASRVLQNASYNKIHITKELTAQLERLAVREHRFQAEHTALLMRLYGEYPSDGLLTAIVTQLLIGGRRGTEYFHWYQAGIDRSLQLMGLYEAYLASLPPDYAGELPHELVLFYTFHGDLPDDLRETLYANILRLYPAGSEIYESYREQMEQFAIVQLLAGRISPNLAPIYQHILDEQMVDERLSAVLPDLLFARQIHCPEPGMVRLLVRYPEFAKEIGFAIEAGQDVCCPIYTEDALLVFVDAHGDRHVFPETTVRPLMEDHGLLAACRRFERPDPMLNLLSLREAMARDLPQEGDWGLLSAACGDAGLHPRYREQIVSFLLQRWDRFRDEPDADDFLVHLDAAAMSRRERAHYVALLTAQGHVREAFAVIGEHGCTGVSSDVVYAVVAGMLQEDSQQESAVLLNLALGLYRRGRADAAVMGYICRFFNGSTAEMRAVLSAACKQKAELSDLPERLLAQMLFAEQTEGIDDVFFVYAAQSRVYHVLAQAYFVWKSYRSLAAGEALPEFFATYLERYWKEASFAGEGRILAAAELLAQLIAEGAAKKVPLMQELTDLLCKNRRFFAFFRDLPREIALPDELAGCVILEYRCEQPGEYEVRTVRTPGGEDSGYVRLDKACEGVYTRPVLLFAGERLSVTYCKRAQGAREVLAEEVVLCGQPYRVAGSLYDVLFCAGAQLAEKTPQAQEAAVNMLRGLCVKERMMRRLWEEYGEGGGESDGGAHTGN